MCFLFVNKVLTCSPLNQSLYERFKYNLNTAPPITENDDVDFCVGALRFFEYLEMDALFTLFLAFFLI